MPTLPQYLLELTVGLGLFGLGYRWGAVHLGVLGRRLYLLLTPVLSLIIPLLYFGPPKAKGELTTADPEFFDYFYRGTYDPDALPPFVLQLGDLVLYGYFIGLVFAAFRLLDRWWKIYRQLQHRSPRRNAHYALIHSSVPRAPYSLLAFIYWNQSRLDRRWRYLWAHERADLRAHHALDAVFMDLLVVLLWFHPFIYRFRRRLRALHADRARSYGRDKLDRLRDYLHSLTAGYRFPERSPGAVVVSPVSAAIRWTDRLGASLTAGLVGVLLVLLFSFDLMQALPGTHYLRGAGQRLTAVGSFELYKYVPPRPPDNYQFYWGRKLSVILPPLAPDTRSPIPTGPSAELTLADFKRALRDEPLLSHQHGSLFNDVAFELSLERNYEDLFNCAVRADAGDPDAYPDNTCLRELVQLVRPNDLLVFKRLRHDTRKFKTHPPDFSIRIREAVGFHRGDPTRPTAYQLRWGDQTMPCYRTPFNYLLCEKRPLDRAQLDTLIGQRPVVDTEAATFAVDQLVLHLKRADTLLGYAYGRHFEHPQAEVWAELDSTTTVELFARIALDSEYGDAIPIRHLRFRARLGEPDNTHRFLLGEHWVAYDPPVDRLFYFPVAQLQATRFLRFTAPDGSPRPLAQLTLENMTSLQRVRLSDPSATYPAEWHSLLAATAVDDLLHLTGTFADGQPLDMWWQLTE